MKYASRRSLLLIAALLVILFALDAWWALSGASDPIDHVALVWLRDPADARSLIVPRWTLQVALAFTSIGGAAIRAPIAVLGTIWLFAIGRRREATAFVLAVASEAIALPIFKAVFARARPDLAWQLVAEGKPSFPSGHALGAAVTFPLLALLLGGRTWLWVGIGLACAIGLSRIFLGVHWLSDVLGGWLLGAAWLCATLAVLGSSPSRGGGAAQA